MNKYVILGVIIIILFAFGAGYKMTQSKNTAADGTGRVKQVTLIARRDVWRWEPEDIEISQGDTVILDVINEDNYDHGIAIEAYGVSQRLPANGRIQVKFVASQVGDFPFYCSVPCGEGTVEGKKRTHFDMIGKLKVQPLASPQTP